MRQKPPCFGQWQESRQNDCRYSSLPNPVFQNPASEEERDLTSNPYVYLYGAAPGKDGRVCVHSLFRVWPAAALSTDPVSSRVSYSPE